LVTPPGAGFAGWFERVRATIARSWRTASLVLLVTQVLPAVALAVIVLGITGALRSPTAFPIGASTARPTPGVGAAFGVLGVGLVGWAIISVLQAVGWAGGTWVLTREALGQPAQLGDALRYGLRRSLGLWGWTLLSGLILLVGLCACLVPGLYLLFPLSLVGPIYLFERGVPIGRAFKLFHANVGPVLGRVALVIGALLVGVAVIGVIQNVGLAAVGDGGFSAVAVIVAVIAGALYLPLYLLQLVGLVATYAEQRAREVPVNTAQLAAQLG
jgi:hypothetical protein